MVRTVFGDSDCAAAFVERVEADRAAARASAKRPRRRASMSERQPGRQLNLPRRAGFTGRQPCSRDLPERRAADDVARRAKVWMVEHIENVHSKLQMKVRPRLGVPDEREIGVVKRRSDDDVSSQVAEMIGGDEYGRIEPP